MGRMRVRPYDPPPIKKQGVNPFFPFIVVVSWGTLRLPPASTKKAAVRGVPILFYKEYFV